MLRTDVRLATKAAVEAAAAADNIILQKLLLQLIRMKEVSI